MRNFKFDYLEKISFIESFSYQGYDQDTFQCAPDIRNML